MKRCFEGRKPFDLSIEVNDTIAKPAVEILKTRLNRSVVRLREVNLLI
jgi:hypothetical protein